MARKLRDPGRDPNHRAGKHTGYSLVDGKYFLAPTYQYWFERIRDREDGIAALVEQVSRFAAKEYAALRYESRRLWETIGEDLDIDTAPRSGWRYVFADGHIEKEKPPEQKPDEPPQKADPR